MRLEQIPQLIRALRPAASRTKHGAALLLWLADKSFLGATLCFARQDFEKDGESPPYRWLFVTVVDPRFDSLRDVRRLDEFALFRRAASLL